MQQRSILAIVVVRLRVVRDRSSTAKLTGTWIALKDAGATHATWDRTSS